MKKKTFLSIALISLMLGSCNNSSHKHEEANSTDSANTLKESETFNLDTTMLKYGATFYQCEMHSSVLSDKPGNCPKCGMELTEIKKN